MKKIIESIGIFPCLLFVFCISFNLIEAKAPNGPWDSFNFAPSSRTIYARSINSINGSVQNAKELLRNGGIAILSPNSSISLDFGKEVGGQISFRFGQSSGHVYLAFCESPLFISNVSDLSNGSPNIDGNLLVKSSPGKLYTVPLTRQRGGFRFLTVVAGNLPAQISNLTLYNTWMPHVERLNEYNGYFYSNDNQLNKIWYAGAYTVQLCSVDRHSGRAFPFPTSEGWFNNGTLGEGSPILVDAPKRDRTVWIGDLGISLHTSFVSTDMLASKHAIEAVLARIDSKTGMFPYCGPPWNLKGSDTYHAWTLVGASSYFDLSDDVEFARQWYPILLRGMDYMFSGVDKTGLFVVTHRADWLRPNTEGRHLGCNSLFYKALLGVARISIALGDRKNATKFLDHAFIVKKAVNKLLWDQELGMYTDNDNTTVTPQDGNSMAILFGLVEHQRAQSISNKLRKRWNQFGPVSAEWKDHISPFISGFEVMAHFTAGNANNGLDLIRLHWGYLMNPAFSTQSTFLEGLLSDGSLGYMNPPFLSQSHGWSTGPTPALSYYVAGLQVVLGAGKIWVLNPSVGNLRNAQGGFTTNLGFFSASWQSSETEFVCHYQVPSGTSGTLGLPGSFKSVLINNVNAPIHYKDGRTFVFGMPTGKNVIVARK